MAKDADKLAELELRVKELEVFKLQAEGAAWVLNRFVVGFTFLGVLGLLCGFVWRYATDSSTIAHHETAITDIKVRLKDTDDSLRFWEKRAFKAPIQAVFQDGQFVSLQGDKLTVAVAENGKSVEHAFRVDPGITAEIDGKQVELRSLKLAPKTPIRFMVGEELTPVVAVQIDRKAAP